jgi:flagellar hook-associated protein 2
MSILSTSSINNLVYNYEARERNKLLSPLNSRKKTYEKRNDSYGDLSSKLSSLKSLLTNFKLTGNESVFATKSTTSSNSDYVTATATTAASQSSYSLFVNQMAKSDLAVSHEMASDTSNAITGTHTFAIKTGDGASGEYISNIEVDFEAGETNQTMMEKIQNAINSDKAIVASNTKTATDNYTGGTSTLIIDVGGTEKEITVNGGGTYEELIDEIILEISENVDGVTAEKVIDSGNVSLKLTVEGSDDYISISNTSGFDLAADLGIEVTKEKGASGIVSASVFTPKSGFHQFSITSKETGVDFRIKDLSDTSGSALSQLGLNLGASRTAFDQSADPDTPGFVYADITEENNLLNSKIKFNGLDIQKNSNDIDDLVNGVTFDLHSTMLDTDNDVSIGISNNSQDVKSQLEDFIKKFNDIYTYIRTSSESNDGVRGVLSGDSNAQSILSSLQSVAYSQVSGIPAGEASFLSQIGISFDYQTGLKISDSDLLETKLKENVDQVEALFNSTNGIANTLYDKINPYLGADGYLANAQSTLDTTLNYLNDRIDSVEKRIEKSAGVLRNRYQQLQSQLANLYQSQSIFTIGAGSGQESYF